MKRQDVTIDTLKKQGYKLYYLHPVLNDLTEYTDQLTIDTCTSTYVTACHMNKAIRFWTKTINGSKYRFTRAISGWTDYGVVFAKAID